MKKQRVGRLVLIWELIRGRKPASNRAERQAKRKFTLDLILQMQHKRALCGHCSSPRPLKGPPTATDKEAALVIHSMALGVEGTRMKVRVKAGHPAPEGEESSILKPRASQSLTTTLMWGSGSQRKPGIQDRLVLQHKPGCSAHISQGIGLQPAVPETGKLPQAHCSPSRLRRGSTAPDRSPTQAGCPCLPRRLQAWRKQTGPPVRPRLPWLGFVRTMLGGAAGGSLPALPVGQGSLQTANRWLSTRTARAGFELVPKHRKLQVSSSAPSKFSSTRLYTEKGRGV